MKTHTPHTSVPTRVRAAQSQSRFLGSTKLRILDVRFLTLAASLACLPVAQGVILTASNPDLDDYFGRSVGISGDRAIVGVSGRGCYKGAVYIYTNLTNGTQDEIQN
jgi:hypothetical protein